MRRLPTLCLLALAPLTGVAPQAQAASLYNLLVGTYTEAPARASRYTASTAPTAR